jgi:hypothetical protein
MKCRHYLAVSSTADSKMEPSGLVSVSVCDPQKALLIDEAMAKAVPGSGIRRVFVKRDTER